MERYRGDIEERALIDIRGDKEKLYTRHRRDSDKRQKTQNTEET